MTPKIPNTVTGVDLYRGDATTDSTFHDLANAGVKVAVLKLGEGGSIDSTFHARYARAKAVGLHVGAYWFVRPDHTPAEQFELIQENLPSECKLFLDIEESLKDPNDQKSDRWMDVTLAQRQSDLAYLVGHFKQMRGGEHPGLYCGTSFWEDVLGAPDGYQACPWWCPRYGQHEPVQAVRLGPWQGWQWTEKGTVPGLAIETVDLSLWCGGFWGL